MNERKKERKEGCVMVTAANGVEIDAEMESMESCVPPGFRFHPTDEELVGYYLRKKVASQKIDLDVIRGIDLYRIEPWDLQDRCRIGYEEQNEWYFFSHKDKKYPTGTRTNRATMAGFWKATGRDKAVYDKTKLIGMRKTLVFYKGRAPNGQKSDWIMHEYRLESDENGPPQEEGWVVCRAFKKRAASGNNNNWQSKSMDGWDSSYFFDESSVLSSIVDPIEYISRQQSHNQNNLLAQNNNNFLCKQELEGDNILGFMHSDTFVQLPQLESPSLPIMKRPSSSVSLLSPETNYNEEEQLTREECRNEKKVTDWRALDKFVASQLSQEERYEGKDVISSFGVPESNSDEGSNDRLFSSTCFLSSTFDCDNIGICIFDK